MADDSRESIEGRTHRQDDWFREPTRREHWIAAGLFIPFGLFFVALFLVQKNWWFRWVILGLGAISIVCGLRHALDATRRRR